MQISIPVKVVPGSKTNEIVGRLGNRLKIKVQAPPEAGAANRAVVELLAEGFAVRRDQLILVFGQSTPEKLFRLTLSESEVVRVQKVFNEWMGS